MTQTSTKARIEAGRATREARPREALAQLSVDDRDPIGILVEQNRTRVPELLPLRTQRMSASPFAFYRGTAAIMAADLARDPHSGIVVASCGDAHLSNFGFYASQERTLMFDLNDFDEAAWAPWEWDLKRLVTSVVVAGQAGSRDDAVIRGAARGAVIAYARVIEAAIRMSPTQRYFSHFAASGDTSTLDPESGEVLRAAIKDAQKRTAERAARKLTEHSPDGIRRFVDAPPTFVRAGSQQQSSLRSLLDSYTASADIDIQLLLRNYRVTDVARRVVGVGSVGTRGYLVLFVDGDDNTLLLQAKEAGQSVLAEYGHAEQPPEFADHVARLGQGGRVVALQRILQASSDPFLGYLQDDGVDYYVRQFHDMKGSIDVEALSDTAFTTYAEACSVVLARAHAQSPRTAEIAGYAGGGKKLAEIILPWAYAYAALSRQDYDAFLQSVDADTRAS
ncbi:DUF2252 domain-containing protein [Protaetiibacter larvae]|uniref:DUF2252 domain-containing protein n=1 Tax=Protaetiibacter larvae TaxID=2592654 RepID=A0A5C1Y985_9MICO|nr:DUF2252 domain-containing protein [Protaetiibacter larvae]QEO09749.1 DUF2252 domain-containing protein [Protaetiibacter larvae]